MTSVLIRIIVYIVEIFLFGKIALDPNIDILFRIFVGIIGIFVFMWNISWEMEHTRLRSVR